MNVRVNLNYPIYDGAEIVFKAPCDASEVTGLIVYYPSDAGVVSSEFTFADAHANDLGNIDALFAAGAVVKVIIDTDTNMAFVQNAVTNAYLEERFAGIGGGGSAEYARYFDIDYDGIVSLKPAYRGHPANATYPYAVSDMGIGADGSKIDELPEKVVIPEVIDGTAVTGFQAGMFHYNYRVKEIVIPDGVQELPDYFCRYAINLRTVNNTEHITKLGGNVLAYTRVEKAIFPNLKEVAQQSLGACGYMLIADIGDNITELPKNFFAQDVMLSQVKGGASVKAIGETAFQVTRNLKNLPLLSHVTSIGKNAFYKSRVQFDWSTLDGKCTFADRATPVIDNTNDYWSGATITPCENPLGTLMSQRDPRWKDEYFGDTNKTYYNGCAVFSVMHVHSALSGRTYYHPNEFAEELRAIDPALVSNAKHPTVFANMVSLLQTLGYNTTVYDSITITTDIYQAVCDALARGAYVISSISTTTDANSGHVVVLYGINSIGEVLVADSENMATTTLNDNGVERDKLMYRMLYQNLSGPASDIVIVEKQ